MADKITIKHEGSTGFAPAPEGQYVAVCVDVIDLGDKVEQYQTNPPKLVHKVALVFQIAADNPDTGKPYEPYVEFTLSFNEKAGLRKFLERWRGRAYKETEAAQGVPLHKLDGKPCLLTLEHKTSQAGRVYAKVNNVSPLPNGLTAITPSGYTRADFWTTRKGEYADEAARFRAANSPRPTGLPADFERVDDDDDGVPF